MSDNTKMFTEDEKIIARNIDKKFEWMARDKSGSLYVYQAKPIKRTNIWVNITIDHFCISYIFGCGMFESIKWADDEPTRISDIYNPQILDEAEREYLKTILKPFHEKVDYVVKLWEHFDDGECYSKEYLFIKLYDGSFAFPSFDPGKMYAGMEQDREYKLDELGIKY